MKDHGSHEESVYGYNLTPAGFSSLISAEYPSLKDTIYLDHAASPPASQSSVVSFANALTDTLYSNPHSQSPSSIRTALEIDRVRLRVLGELFGVRGARQEHASAGWDVIFTSGATAAMKLVGETFQWNPSTTYRYLKESHTSLVGIRECALAKGASVEALDISDDDLLCDSGDPELTLWAYPAQCNVTGSRLGLQFARELKCRHKIKTAVLVDAAAYISTSSLDLDSIPYDEAPDFIACSFYKIYVSPLRFRSGYTHRLYRAIPQVSGPSLSNVLLPTSFPQPTHISGEGL